MPDRTFIIAEAGVNHDGSIDMALHLIETAANAGADAVKFQTFISEKLVSRFAPKAEYQIINTAEAGRQLDMLKKLEISRTDHHILVSHCKKNRIMFMSSAFDEDSIDFLAEMDQEIWKIPSGEITNKPYLQKIASLGKKIILSTGMCSIGEIDAALNVISDGGTAYDAISLLHCTTEYPTPMNDVNLRAMLTMKEAFKLPVGYSDHTIGIAIPIAAVAMGATIIEKHFTLDKTLPGPDHKASLNPVELAEMVERIRDIEKALGTGIKKPSESESKNIVIARKSIVCAKPIRQGETLTRENITIKRPGSGISPMLFDMVLGKTAPRNFEEDELIEI